MKIIQTYLLIWIEVKNVKVDEQGNLHLIKQINNILNSDAIFGDVIAWIESMVVFEHLCHFEQLQLIIAIFLKVSIYL